jgi:hypothetical protein
MLNSEPAVRSAVKWRFPYTYNTDPEGSSAQEDSQDLFEISNAADPQFECCSKPLMNNTLEKEP